MLTRIFDSDDLRQRVLEGQVCKMTCVMRFSKAGDLRLLTNTWTFVFTGCMLRDFDHGTLNGKDVCKEHVFIHLAPNTDMFLYFPCPEGIPQEPGWYLRYCFRRGDKVGLIVGRGSAPHIKAS